MGVARIWNGQWKRSRAEGAPRVSWVVFENAFLGSIFPHNLREMKLRDFLI